MKNFYFLFIILLFSCDSKEKISIEKEHTTVKYAENFDLINRDGFVELHILNPEFSSIEYKYALVKRGEQVNLSSDLVKIEIPIQNMGAFSTSFIGMIAQLDACK